MLMKIWMVTYNSDDSSVEKKDCLTPKLDGTAQWMPGCDHDDLG